jgi:hypothetical protein
MTDRSRINLPSRLTTARRADLAVRHADLASESKREIAEALAPGLEHLLTAAGMRVTQEQVDQLRKAFGERGVIEVPPGGEEAAVSGTLSVAGSLNYASQER